MKCDKCGFDNAPTSTFCGNCGNKLSNVNVDSKKTKPDNKKKLLIIGIIVAIVVVLVIILIVVKAKKFRDPFGDIDNLTFVEQVPSQKGLDDYSYDTFYTTLDDDYQNGKITKDEYVMQLAYSIFDKSKIDSKYKTLSIDNDRHCQFFEIVSDIADDLSEETLEYVIGKYALSDVQLAGGDDTDNKTVGDDSKKRYKVQQMFNEYDVSLLSEVVLSENGNFLVYYTKSGINAFDTDKAKQIANNLEKVIKSYKDNYGLEYKYEIHNVSNLSRKRAINLLKSNNIDPKYLDTAMPIYVVDIADESTMGRYTAYYSKLYTLTQQLIGGINNNISANPNDELVIPSTTYALPYFVVDSHIESADYLNSVIAHELFHHYQRYICGNGNYDSCKSGLFTTETTATMVASQTFPNNNSSIQTGWATAYNVYSSISINQMSAYAAHIFALNYADSVDNGYNIWFDSMKTTDALKSIYDVSNEDYHNTFLKTAEKILTLDYSNNNLMPRFNNRIIYPANHATIGTSSIKKSESIAYSSSHYYYINPTEYSEEAQIGFNSNTKNLDLLLFVKEDSSYKKVYTHPLTSDFVIDISDFTYYDEVVFAVVDSAISGSDSYSYEVSLDGKKKATVTAESLGLKTLNQDLKDYSSIMCYSYEEDDSFKTVYQLKLSFNKKGKVNDMFFKGTMQIKDYDPNNYAYKIAKNIVSVGLTAIQELYENKFKHYKVYTEDEYDKFSVVFNVTKNYYDVLSDSFGVNGKTKTDIMKFLQADGYTCKYEK